MNIYCPNRRCNPLDIECRNPTVMEQIAYHYLESRETPNKIVLRYKCFRCKLHMELTIPVEICE